MAIEGKIRNRNGKMFVVYTTTLDSAPVRRILWYHVIESYSNRYNMNRPEDGDIARHEAGSGGNWTVSNRSGSAGRVVVEDKAEVEESGVEPPAARGKQLRWSNGRWEKLMASGWVAAGEGGAGDPNNPNAPAKAKAPRKPRPSSPSSGKSAAQLEREVQEAIASGKI